MSDIVIESYSLPTVADEQLAKARETSSGRAAATVHGGAGKALRQTVMTLLADHELSAHDSPGEASLQVLRGRVRVTTEHGAWVGGEGEYLVVPPVRHAVVALEDSVFLLTVVRAQS